MATTSNSDQEQQGNTSFEQAKHSISVQKEGDEAYILQTLIRQQDIYERQGGKC